MASPSARIVWGFVGLTALGAALSWGSWWLLTAWLVPDLGVLAGGFRKVDEHGSLKRRAAIGYNAMHTLIGPAATVGLAAATGSLWVAAVAALWVSHIGVDRALEYRLRPLHG